MSSYINAHASLCLWLEAFPNRLQDYHQLIKGKEEAGVSNFLKMTTIINKPKNSPRWLTEVSNKGSQVEVPGIEPGASYMRSTRSTTELHPRCDMQMIPL